MLRPLTTSAAIDDGVIPHITSRGEPFVQLYQRLGHVGLACYSNFEVEYDAHKGTDFARRFWWAPLFIGAVYLAAVFGGQRFMAGRERMNLRYHLAAWNGLLCLFSFAGALRTVPELLYRLGSESMTDTICNDPAATWGAGATGLWVQLFIFSKIPELVDTYFIVARKRPLLFLHWYHHITVMWYCWHSYATEAGQALYFVAMNYSVHAIMYGYYCLMALKIPSGVPPILITAAQISQMVVGVGVQGFATYKFLQQKPEPESGGATTRCHVNGVNLLAGGLMYASYFALFAKFAVGRYCKSRSPPSKVAKENAKGAKVD